MRDELNLMELADQYLRGIMSPADRTAFEERMRTNPELRELVEDQRALHKGMERVALRTEVNKAYRSYKRGKWLPGIGGAAIVALLAVGGWMLMNNGGGLDRDAGSDGHHEQSALITLPDTAGIDLPALVFTIDPKADTTLITPNGLVLDIPRGAFIGADGRAITTPVRVTLLEAIDGLDIMKAGLSTMSGDTLLETGGMFYLDAQVDGQRVGIDPAKPLTVMVPSDKADPKMMLYEGVMADNGIVDWRNPKPLVRSLIPVDINTLDFYPPGYLAKVAELGQDATDKGYTDSLYWSFSGARPQVAIADTTRAIMMLEQLSSISDYSPYHLIAAINHIDPAKVKTIWHPRFNGTNIATRAFEERIRAIHGTCNYEVLDLYVKNLDKNLSELDSMVFSELDPIFGEFALRNDGRVELPPHAAERLREFYLTRSRIEADAIRQVTEKYQREQRKQDIQAARKRDEHALAESIREGQLLQREFDANLDTVCKQLGYQRARSAGSAWVVPVTNPGWWNVDKAVMDATTSRTSMSYTDDKSGKTATLTYTPITIEVEEKTSFSELRVYLIPKALNSYQRVLETDGAFTERLNANFQYDLVCMGRKDGQLYAASLQNIAASASIRMQPTDEESLQRMVRTPQVTTTTVNNFVEQARHLKWLELEAERQKARGKKEDLRNALLPVVFPCTGVATDSLQFAN